MRNLTARLLMSVLSLGCLAGLAHAQTGPTGPTGSGPAPTQPTQVGQVMNQVTVVAYLKKLDPNLQMLSKQQNWTYYALTLQGKDRSYKIEAAVNGGYLFLNCYLGQPIAPARLSRDVLVKMLKVNTSIGPSYFHFVDVQGGVQLALSHRLDVTVTPERLQAGLNEFLGDIHNSIPVWSEALKMVGQ
jgi:hypothetical protein